MNASRFCLSQALIAATLFVGAPCALAQTAEDNAPEARAPGTSAEAPAPDTQRERGRRRGSKNEPPATTSATAPAVAPFPAQPASKAADPNLICKYDPLPGTKVKRKICGTAEQWATWRKQAQENADELARKNREHAGTNARPDLSQRQMPPGGGL